MAQQIQLRHDTAANWTSANPTLMIGEYGYETDTQKHKIGDGVTAWASLAYSPVDPSLLSSAVPISKGGTGQTTKAAAFDALSPNTTTGDIAYYGASSNTRLAGSTSATKQFLTQTGTGTASAAPAWGTIAVGDIPTLNQNTTGSAGTASTATAPVTGSAHGAVTLDVSGHFQSVAPGVAGGYLRSNGTDFVRSAIQGSDVPTLNQSTTGNAATATSPAAGTGHGAVTLSSLGAFQSVAPGTTGNVLQSNGTDWVSAAPAATTYTAPTVQKFTSGSGTYTRPTPAPLYIRVRMVGGGGGAGGSTSNAFNAGTGGTGGNTTFGTTLLAANGGTGGGANTNRGGAGGTASLGTGPVGVALSGGYGSDSGNPGTANVPGGAGGVSPFGGAGQSSSGAAVANTGSGGAGPENPTTGGSAGSGGGAGGFVDALITSPASTYAYAVGSGGTAGTAGTSGSAGGAGAAGMIEVTEFYQ